jgi:hypothetical protein
MEKISWTDRLRNEEVLLRVKDEKNILYMIKQKDAKLIGHICRNCLLLHIIEGKIEKVIELLEDKEEYNIQFGCSK